MIERMDERFDGAVESQRVGDFGVLADGVNGRVARTAGGGVAGHVAAQGEDQDSVRLELVGKDDGALDELLALGSELGPLMEASAAATLDAPGDTVEHFDALEGIFADRG